MTNNWRALARMARDRIVQADPSDIEVILSVSFDRPHPERYSDVLSNSYGTCAFLPLRAFVSSTKSPPNVTTSSLPSPPSNRPPRRPMSSIMSSLSSSKFSKRAAPIGQVTHLATSTMYLSYIDAASSKHEPPRTKVTWKCGKNGVRGCASSWLRSSRR